MIFSSIPSRNYDVSVVVDGTNENNILQVLFNKAHLSAIHSCKPIGDPKVSIGEEKISIKSTDIIFMINRLMKKFIYLIN